MVRINRVDHRAGPVFGFAVNRLRRAAIALCGLVAAAPCLAGPAAELKDQPDIDLYALMSGRCNTLKVAGQSYACKTVAYFHSETGRANFTVAVDDPRDSSHVIAFSGENASRTQDNVYELSIDRMLLKSADRPKIDGLPVPSVELSSGICRQIGNFAARQVSTVYCSATANNGARYEFHFESDGTPIELRRVRMSEPTIRQDPYR